MYIRTLISSVILVLSIFTKAYSQNTDKYIKDSLYTEQLIKEIKALQSVDSILYQKKVDSAGHLVTKHDFKLLKGSLFIAKAVYLYNNYQFDLAERYVDTAYSIFLTLGDKPNHELWKARALSMKAVFYGLKGDSEKEQKIYLSVIPLYEKQKEYWSLKIAYLNLGNIFFGKSQYDKALEYFTKSHQIKADVKSKNYVAQSPLYMAMTYNELNDIPNMGKYLDSAYMELSAYTDSVPQWAFYYHLRGQNEILKKEYAKAIRYNQLGLAFSEKIDDLDNISNNKGGLATALSEMGRYAEALSWEKDYYQYTKSVGKWHYTAGSLKRMAKAEYELGNINEAYDHLSEYTQLSDSLKEDDVIKRVHTLEAEFQSAQKAKEIAQLQYQNERKDWQLQRNNTLMFGTITVVVVLMVLALLLYQNNKNQQHIRLQEKDLHTSQVAQMAQKHDIEMLSSLIQGAENERQRLGRDLHDGLGGLLSGLKMKLNALFRQSNENDNVLQGELNADLDHAITEMRFVSQSLLPDLLQNYGMTDALQQYCARLSSDDLRIDFQSVNVQELPDKDRQLMFYRIAQELINNAVKHAKAKEIFVQLQQREKEFFLTVEDDGVGFDEKERKGQGAGLNNLKSRINYLKGTLEISTSLGKGTSVFVTCPI